MTADTLKSASITALDAAPSSGAPIVAATSGNGAAGYKKSISDSVTPTTGGLVSTSSTYKMVRLPTNVYLQDIALIFDAAVDSGSPALAWDVGAYYSDSTTDGTPAALQGTEVGSANNQFAAAVVAYSGRDVVTDGAWTSAKRRKQLWDALGLTTDPGGNFDIVLTVHTAANTAASHPVELRADFIMP